MKALVGVDLKATDVLPQDGQVDGFDNIAAALTVSPAFLSQYVTAARQVAKLAVGNPNPRVVEYEVHHRRQFKPRRASAFGHPRRHRFQTQLPGRRRVSHHHQRPRSGHIRLHARESEHAGHHDRWQDCVPPNDRRTGGSGSLPSQGAPGRAQIMERFSKIPVQVEAGVHDVVVAFIDRSHVESPTISRTPSSTT